VRNTAVLRLGPSAPELLVTQSHAPRAHAPHVDDGRSVQPDPGVGCQERSVRGRSTHAADVHDLADLAAARLCIVGVRVHGRHDKFEVKG
jgi:hypothetical protein